MDNHVSPFIKKSKSWIIKSVIGNYFTAFQLFEKISTAYKEEKPEIGSIYLQLKTLTELLYAAKESLHLIYKRRDIRKAEIEQDVQKFDPTPVETQFIHNIGLLFHKATVARELQYMLEFYEVERDEEHVELQDSLDDYMHRLIKLFQNGHVIIREFLKIFENDAVILSYFFENQPEIERIFGENIGAILNHIDDLATRGYVHVAEYFIESGWRAKAKDLLTKALELLPGNDYIKQLMAAC
ncbi:MAG: hypothetical protein EHM72_13750 [Calditrichaeota bacterium]|nr:MAG: hypothetical protein EHM72_13750 [Calditrichota bacterium]